MAFGMDLGIVFIGIDLEVFLRKLGFLRLAIIPLLMQLAKAKARQMSIAPKAIS
ncbi:hypothetical protein AwWohl_15060 [Gammaproteobacteria bacterium]|nr:hypothetical protein AwWohl_15060 [Gammaproteobacteria bacterium]